jgi:putative hydrolase of the HAD superfamily
LARQTGRVIEAVAFDGDDTLWHNEAIFSLTQDRFGELMAPYVDAADLGELLYATESRNLELYGYGIKSFTLSMIETAIDVSEGRVTAREIAALLDAAKDMVAHPVDLLDAATEAVEAVSATHPVLLITKGDLFDQEGKLARSGLGDRFSAIEIVSEKNRDTYRRILDRHEIPVDRFLMVGNSIRSDIQPVLDLGGWAAHVPYHILWQHEQVDDEAPVRGHDRFRHLESLAGLADLVAELDGSRPG